MTSSDKSLFYASNDEHKRQRRSVSNAMKKVDNKTVNKVSFPDYHDREILKHVLQTFMNVNVLKDLIEEAISDNNGEVLATE